MMRAPVPFSAGPFGAVFMVWGMVGVLFICLVLARHVRGVRARRSAEFASRLRSELVGYAAGIGDTGVLEGLPIRASPTGREAPPAVEVDLMLLASGLLTKVTGEQSTRRLKALLNGLGMDAAALTWIRSRRASRRALAAEYLARAGTLEALPSLLGALNDRQRGVRVAAAYGLVQFATPEIGRCLLEACVGEHGIPRIFASDVAVKMGPPVAGAMVEGLSHPSRDVRMVAIDAVAGLGLVEAVPHLDEYVRTRRLDRDLGLRAVRALGMLGQARSAPLLAECLGPLDTAAMRRAACAALGGIGTPVACDVLSKHLDDEPDIARQAAEALAATGSGRSVLSLRAAGSGRAARAAAWGLWSVHRRSFASAGLPPTDVDYLAIIDAAGSSRTSDPSAELGTGQ